MRYGKPTLRDSFFGWLGVGAPKATPDARVRILNIRDHMLGELAQGPATTGAALARQIRYATDAQALWHCRGDLMQALSRWRGEAAATATLMELTRLFDGLVPPGMMQTRTGPRRR